TDIAGKNVEKRTSSRREKADVERRIKKEDGLAGAVEDVLKVIGCCSLAIEAVLQLIVQGCQFLVPGLLLLFRDQQFLVDRLEFRIRRQYLLIGNPLFFGCDFEVMYGGFEIVPGCLQFPLQSCDTG